MFTSAPTHQPRPTTSAAHSPGAAAADVDAATAARGGDDRAAGDVACVDLHGLHDRAALGRVRAVRRVAALDGAAVALRARAERLRRREREEGEREREERKREAHGACVSGAVRVEVCGLGAGGGASWGGSVRRERAL
ncbi:hypothetical protein AcV5_001838 [Taiwanofungus camphoratus]|nr:hypothetical protein AcV5_001838 [Antrodia cinnamomea]